MRKNGFTLIEALVVLVVIATTLAILIPILREREHQRLQAMADAEPWKVFDLRAKPARDPIVEGDEIHIRCEIVNLTEYPLTPPKNLDRFNIHMLDADFRLGSLRSPSPESLGTIEPGESVIFEVTFFPFARGEVEIRLESALSTPVNLTRRNVPTSAVKRLESPSFQLHVKDSVSPYWPTFDEAIAKIRGRPSWSTTSAQVPLRVSIPLAPE